MGHPLRKSLAVSNLFDGSLYIITRPEIWKYHVRTSFTNFREMHFRLIALNSAIRSTESNAPSAYRETTVGGRQACLARSSQMIKSEFPVDATST